MKRNATERSLGRRGRRVVRDLKGIEENYRVSAAEDDQDGFEATAQVSRYRANRVRVLKVEFEELMRIGW